MSDTKERLAQRRAEEHQKVVEATMAARSAAVEQIGQQIGAPVDFTKGIDFGPPPAPKTGENKAPQRPNVVLPKPPALTRAEEDQLTIEEARAEREAYQASMREAGIIPPKPANPAEYQSRRRDVPRLQSKKPPHPLLVQLRQEFGIGSKEKPPIDIKIADHVWTFMPLSPDLISYAARTADVLSETVGEHALRSKQAAVCFSIIAIDSVPVWAMFGLQPTERDDITFPLIPKGPIRQNAAVELFSELTGGMKNRLLDALYEAYLAKVDPEGSVASYTTYEKIEHVVWVCAEPECEHRFSKPRRYDDNNQELPYFCELHGSEMIDVSTTKPRIAEDLSPLG